MQMSLMSPQQPTQTISTKNNNKVGLKMANVQQHRNSTPRLNHNSAVIDSSSDSDDSTPLAQLIGAKKRLTLESNEPPAPKATKKPKGQKKKKDPNEPQKPVSAYALFFRDTQAAIKGQSPNASFGEVSKIVASMWESLDVDRKNSYKKRTEIAKKEYLKALAAYRANLVSKAEVDQSNSMHGKSSPPIASSPHGSPSGHISLPKQPSPEVLTSVVQSTQPVTNDKNVHPQQNQQKGPMQSPPQMNNSSPSHVMHGANSMNNIGIQNNQLDVPQIDMNSSPPNCNSALSSPSYNQSTASIPPGDSPNPKNTDMMDPLPICLRNGCTNVAIDSPDWDREYCSSECVVSHCKDAFATWVTQRQLNSHLTTIN